MSEQMLPELLPCPFCGKAPRLCDMGGWEIFCECGADMCLHVEAPEPFDLARQWNTRATQPQAPQGGVTREQLEAAFEAEIAKVSHVAYDSNEICRHFFNNIRTALCTAHETPEGQL